MPSDKFKRYREPYCYDFKVIYHFCRWLKYWIRKLPISTISLHLNQPINWTWFSTRKTNVNHSWNVELEKPDHSYSNRLPFELDAGSLTLCRSTAAPNPSCLVPLQPKTSSLLKPFLQGLCFSRCREKKKIKEKG